MRVRTNIVRIGNSRGVRIPKALLEDCGLGRTVELEVENGRLVIRPVHHARAGWDEAFRQMGERGDDELLDRESRGPTAWGRHGLGVVVSRFEVYLVRLDPTEGREIQKTRPSHQVLAVLGEMFGP